MNTKRAPKVRFKGFTDAWELRKFESIAARASSMSADPTLPRVEYEDIISGIGLLNKDVKLKGISKPGIVFNQGDVLYGKLRPYLHNWFLPSFSGLAVGDFWVLQPKDADSSFLFRLIQGQQFDDVANQSIGTKMPRADWNLVSKTLFFVPPSIDEQALIGRYFRSIDNLITLHQRKLDKTKKLKKAFLNLIFSQKLRFYGFEDKWKKEKLKNVLKISNERNKNNLFSKNDVISVSREAGTVNQIEYQGRSFAGNDISNYKVIKPGDLIYTKSPLKDAPYGIFQEATIIGIVSPLYAVYKSTDRVFAPFVAMLLKNDSNSTQYLSPLVSKGAKNTINISDAGALDGNLFFPKIEEQKKFYLLYTKINKTIIFHQKKLDNLKDLKKVLLRNMLI
ncbi:restriction endonuclease subunit S [Phascolarctobacterium faecium]|jgi:hsdS-type I specificity subunit|uniref:restriction endonuclease subunit S n=2 Tax=Phascolarctobacterium faecium TaxID=33025 RepID=UPI003AB8B4A8